MTASFTFTADAGTDTITTSAPHGKVTGDGPMVVRNVGGALPSGYTALLDVYAIVTGASTMKLALSSADALANIPILISDAGTGTHYLEIGIPYRRPRTYAPGVQLKSADLNDNFDALKALHALLTGQSQSIWTVTGDVYRGDRILTTNGLAGHGTNWFTDTDGCMSYGGAGTEYLLVPIGLQVGDRIKSVSFQFSGDSSVDLTVNVQSLSATMVETQIGTVTVTNQSSTWAVTTIDVTDTVIVANGSIFLECVTNAIGGRIGTICVTYDRP
jgi:hypothetical protein